MEIRPLREVPEPIAQAMEQARNRNSWYSFGDDSVTATVGASGGLLQMARFFSNENFKTPFCVDSPFIIEPYFVGDRIDTLFTMATDPYSGQGIDIAMMGPTLEYTGSRPATPRVVHDRWPHFTFSTENGIKFETQYLASHGSIYQTSVFDFSESSQREELPKMVANKDLLIRNLDFIDHANDFNEAKSIDPSYQTQVSDEGLFIRSHQTSSNAHVVLFISAFSADSAVSFVQTDEGSFELQWNEATIKQFEDQGKLEVTFAYTLEYLPLGSIALTVPVPPDSAMKQIQHEPFEPQSFTEYGYLDPVLGRNLEYILSVCSIPVTRADSSGIRAIALTCGDLDGHRVATAASFYAFQFLLLALKHFNEQLLSNSGCECKIPSECCPLYLCRMTARILHTCKGHLRWLFEKAERSRGVFAPHYWVDGHEIIGWEKNDYLPGKALVDMPFQLIKAGDFQSLPKANEISEGCKSVIKETASAWVEDLDQMNMLGLYAFPRFRNEPTHNFYFTDHVLIWRAIKAIESLKINLPQIPILSEKKTQIDSTTPKQQSKKVKNYSSTRVQQNILKRFTTENPLSRKRMIAVSRGPGQTRFLLRNKDAALFYAMEQGFFDRPGAKGGSESWQNKVDVWKNTIDCQIRHEDNDDIGWNEPLRFALSIIMAWNGKQINARPVSEMRVHALTVLLRSCSPSGIFPGALDENNEPIVYRDELMRDTYWGVTFEIPYLLWKYYPQPTGLASPVDAKNQTLPSPTVDKMSSAPTHPEFWVSLKEALENQVGGKGMANLLGHSMKQNFPFNNVVFQENIVELSDEWLYNKPSFFVPPRKKNNAGDHANKDMSEFQVTTATTEGPWLKRSLPMEKSIMDISFVGVVVDVPKSKHLKKKPLHLREMMDTFIADTSIQRRMMEGRSPETAKKRFWAFFAQDPSKNKICCQTYSLGYEDEQEGAGTIKDNELSSFFRKHETYDKFFLEETESVLNSWTTELHLSFYKTGEKKAAANRAATNAPHERLLSLPDVEDQHYTQIVRASVSFRFDGDFFDRYWTCWYLLADPQTQLNIGKAKKDMELLLEGEQQRKNKAHLQKAPWRQRRVLELLLFHQAIHSMREGADKILDLAKSCIWKKSRNPSENPQDDIWGANELHHNTFLATRQRFERLQKVLQIVQEDLTENLIKVEHWSNREKERQAERPRWTFNDESRYRSVISKLNILNNHEVQELGRSYAKIKSFNELTAKKLDTWRNDIDQQRADDIQRFTRVTIIFLPMGLATGLFSMNGAPPGQTLWNMVVTTIVALLLTVLLLYYDSVSRIVRKIKAKVYKFLSSTPGSEKSKGEIQTKQRDNMGRAVELNKNDGGGADLERGQSTIHGGQSKLGETAGR
ncbi:hypothetical protein NW762_011694 [Fusarium torreyae]|uniref:Mg2+ transporter zinc transport protein n=1 Tax=Fusarium torreyae TaxID=1237075 RepID=A0A9W8RQP1_9HYPO|nr:hypothetical protein NW762_011694 [Fusarium torreyae]